MDPSSSREPITSPAATGISAVTLESKVYPTNLASIAFLEILPSTIMGLFSSFKVPTLSFLSLVVTVAVAVSSTPHLTLSGVLIISM